MTVVDCGTIEEPRDALKAVVEGDLDEVTRLCSAVTYPASRHFWFTSGDLSRYKPERLTHLKTTKLIQCRFSLVGLAIVFGSEEVFETVLKNVPRDALTNTCRVAHLNSLPMTASTISTYQEMEPFLLITKASLFHDPSKYTSFDMLQAEFGVDLTQDSTVINYIVKGRIDYQLDSPFPDDALKRLIHGAGCIQSECTRRESVISVTAHELPLDVLDRYCQLHPETLLPGGCLHAGKALLVGDMERLKVLAENGMHHRPEYARKVCGQNYFKKVYSTVGVQGRYVLSLKHVEHLICHRDSLVQWEAWDSDLDDWDELSFKAVHWLAALQYCCGFEFQRTQKYPWMCPVFPEEEIPEQYEDLLEAYDKKLKRCFHMWNGRFKSLSFLARNALRLVIPIQGFKNTVAEMAGDFGHFRDEIGCNVDSVHRYFEVAPWKESNIHDT